MKHWMSRLSLAGMVLLVAGVLSACATVAGVVTTNSAFYAITRGNDTVSSSLYMVSAQGEATLIGDTGHSLVSIKVDPTDGTLYATTRQTDSGGCNNCLVTLNTTTGAATVVGTLEHDADPLTDDGPVPSIAFTSNGDMYGWTEDGDDAVSIDKTTGVVTILGDSGVSSYGHGMWTDMSDTLWFINGNGDVYTVDKGTGAVTMIHAGADIAADAGLAYSGDLMVRGDIDAASGEYWGVGTGYGATTASAVVRMDIDMASASYLGPADVDVITNIHNIAFP